jgi:hypothetical protein
VRSGEPFRVQAYSLLASTRASSSSTSNGSSAALSGGGQGSGGVQRLAAGLPQVADPLGVAAAVGPALEVLDAMYAGKLSGQNPLVSERSGVLGTGFTAWCLMRCCLAAVGASAGGAGWCVCG